MLTPYPVSKRGTEESILGESKQEEQEPKSDATVQDQTSSSHHARKLCRLHLSTILIALLWNSKVRMSMDGTEMETLFGVIFVT